MLVYRRQKDLFGVGANYGIVLNPESKSIIKSVRWLDGTSSETSSRYFNVISKEYKIDYDIALDQLIILDKDKVKVFNSTLNEKQPYLVSTTNIQDLTSEAKLSLNCLNYENVLELLYNLYNKGFPAINPTNLNLYVKGIKQNSDEVNTRLLNLWVFYNIIKNENKEQL